MSLFLQLSLARVIVVLAAKASGWVSVCLRQPAALGELLASEFFRVADRSRAPLAAPPPTTGSPSNSAGLRPEPE